MYNNNSMSVHVCGDSLNATDANFYKNLLDKAVCSLFIRESSDQYVFVDCKIRSFGCNTSLSAEGLYHTINCTLNIGWPAFIELGEESATAVTRAENEHIHETWRTNIIIPFIFFLGKFDLLFFNTFWVTSYNSHENTTAAYILLSGCRLVINNKP